MKIFEDLDLYLFFNHKKNIFMINQINFLWAHFSCIWRVPSETVILIFVYFTFWFLLLLFNKKYLICRFIWILDWATGCAKSAMRLVFGPNQSQSLFEVQKKEDKIVMGLSWALNCFMFPNRWFQWKWQQFYGSDTGVEPFQPKLTELMRLHLHMMQMLKGVDNLSYKIRVEAAQKYQWKHIL